jgi:hypothetical protein
MAKSKKQTERNDERIYDYPLFSGKMLGNATREDLRADAALEEEIEAIGAEMGEMTINEFFKVSPTKALRFVEYVAKCELLAPFRAEALGDPEPESNLIWRSPRSELLTKFGRDLNG